MFRSVEQRWCPSRFTEGGSIMQYMLTTGFVTYVAFLYISKKITHFGNFSLCPSETMEPQVATAHFKQNGGLRVSDCQAACLALHMDNAHSPQQSPSLFSPPLPTGLLPGRHNILPAHHVMQPPMHAPPFRHTFTAFRHPFSSPLITNPSSFCIQTVPPL